MNKNGSIQYNPVVNPMQGGVDLTPLATLAESNSSGKDISVLDRLTQQKPIPDQIVEAQAIAKGNDGILYLVTSTSNAIPSSRPVVSACVDVGKF